MKRCLLAWCVAWALPLCAQEVSWTGWVSWVMDGDTLLLVKPGQGEPVKLRVDGIDAPEICQPGGGASRDAMMRLALRKSVSVQERGHDHYGRQVARLSINGEDLGAEMVRSGMAWAYRYRVGAGPYAKLQKGAQKDKRGLFAASDTAMAPPVFRQFHGSCHVSVN